MTTWNYAQGSWEVLGGGHRPSHRRWLQARGATTLQRGRMFTVPCSECHGMNAHSVTRKEGKKRMHCDREAYGVFTMLTDGA